MRTRRIGAVLALLATLGLGYGALSPGWYTVETDQLLRVGPLGAQRCGVTCGSVALERLGVDGNIGKLGLLVAVASALAALLLLATAGLGLMRESLGKLPSMSLAMAVFAVCSGLAFHLLSPFSDSMAVGMPAFVFFGGAALAGATAAVVYGGIRKPADPD